MLTRLVTFVLIALAVAAGPARAQGGAAPYDRDLQRLAEILGALHYLRALCNANEGQKWRNEMQALVYAETPRRRAANGATSWSPASTADIADFSRLTARARPLPISSFAVISRKAPRSPAILRRDTQIDG